MSVPLPDDLFISLISDIKTYSGTDPIIPWGIRKMKESLSNHIIREKMPRFLQNCAQTFQFDSRFANDIRYIRVWLQLMDFVDDPKALLITMEEKRIGMKRSLFYQAYALYYEKLKKFEKADMMYHRGVQNLAEPLGDLKKSYEQFLERMEKKQKKIQSHQRMSGKGILLVKSVPIKFNDTRKLNEKMFETHSQQGGAKDQVSKETVQHVMLVKEPKLTTSNIFLKKISRRGSEHLNQQSKHESESDNSYKFCGEDTVVRFVDTAIVGSKEADTCLHGLVEPTINTKEALNAINSMFREPLDPKHVNKRSNKSQPKPKVHQKVDREFEVFVDQNMNDTGLSYQNGEKGYEQGHQEPFQIFVDEEEDDIEERDSKEDLERSNAFIFPSPKDFTECSDHDLGRSSRARFREDTVVRRFVGTTISDDPKVENVCHHGLVEPTINLKEAMDDINSMFGKPIDFVRTTRRKRQEKALNGKNQSDGFVILPDVELDDQRENLKARSTCYNRK